MKNDVIANTIREFIEHLKSASDLEIYNEAGLQHEMAFFLKQNLGSDFRIQLERPITVCGYDHKEYCKKEMDIYISNKKNPKDLYCVELKVSQGRAVPRRMYLAFKDVMFLEQLRNSGFTKCFLFFTSPEKAFWEMKMANQNLRKYFYGTQIKFNALYKDDVASFLKSESNDDCILPIKGKYTSKWKDLKEQNNEKWRYFLLEI